MPITVGVTVYNSAQEPVSKFDAIFEDSSWDVLGRFARYEQDLASAEFVKAGMPHDLSFAWSGTGHISLPALPPDPQLREFLHLLRPLILENEPTWYWKVQGILGTALPHEALRQRIGFLNEFFQGRISTDLMTVNVEGLTINSQSTLDLWLNAFEYHRDADKQAVLEKATQIMPFPLAKAFFVDLLIMKAEAIQGLAALIRDMQAAVERRRGWVG